MMRRVRQRLRSASEWRSTARSLWDRYRAAANLSDEHEVCALFMWLACAKRRTDGRVCSVRGFRRSSCASPNFCTRFRASMQMLPAAAPTLRGCMVIARRCEAQLGWNARVVGQRVR